VALHPPIAPHRRPRAGLTSRPRQNVRIGTDLVTTELPGLQVALARAPVELTLDLRRLNGDMLSVELLFPDEVSALTLNAFAQPPSG
jgi:hypothetical protein